jgi:hypothetical protein
VDRFRMRETSQPDSHRQLEDMEIGRGPRRVRPRQGDSQGQEQKDSGGGLQTEEFAEGSGYFFHGIRRDHFVFSLHMGKFKVRYYRPGDKRLNIDRVDTLYPKHRAESGFGNI